MVWLCVYVKRDRGEGENTEILYKEHNMWGMNIIESITIQITFFTSN